MRHCYTNVNKQSRLLIWLFRDAYYQLEGFLMAQMVNNLLAMQKTRVCSLGGEDPLEKGMKTHFSVLEWRIPWTEEPGGL